MFWLTITTYVRGAGALLTATIVPLLPALLAAQALLVVQSLDGTVTEGALTPSGEPRTAGLWLAAAAGVLTLVGGPVALGAGILVGGGAMLGHRVPVGPAWRRSLRRYPTVLGWAVQISLLAVVTAVAIVYPLLLLELPPVLVLSFGVIVGFVAIMFYDPVILSLPVALIADTGLGEARRTVRRLRRNRPGVHLVFVLLALGVSWGTNTGLVWAAEGLPLPIPAFAQVTFVSFFGPMLLWPWVLLLLCAPLLHAPFATVRTGYALAFLDMDRVRGRLPRAVGPTRTRPARTAAVALAALLLPPLIAPVTAWANPSGTPAVTTASFETNWAVYDSTSVTMRTDGSPTEVLIAARGVVYKGDCDPDCGDFRSVTTVFYGQTAHTKAGDWLVVADWAREGASGLRISACEGRCDHSGEVPSQYPSEEPFDSAEVFADEVEVEHLAMAALDEDPVLVTHTAVPPEDSAEEPEARDLTLWVCEDAFCSDHEAVGLPPVPLQTNGGDRDPAALEVAAGADGGIAVTAMDLPSGELTLVTCADEGCEDPAVRQLVEPDRDWTASTDRERPFGARVELRPDGTPVVAYRAPEDGSARLIDCEDASCSVWEERELTGPGYSRPVPGLAVDSAGLPRVVTFNETDGPETDTGQLVLVSCQDPGCAESTTLPLAALDEAPAFGSVELDGDDRPHIVWAQEDPDYGWVDALELLRCEAPLCGAGG
ncbi:hypothetical protein [Nocardiopsis oceani]